MQMYAGPSSPSSHTPTSRRPKPVWTVSSGSLPASSVAVTRYMCGPPGLHGMALLSARGSSTRGPATSTSSYAAILPRAVLTSTANRRSDASAAFSPTSNETVSSANEGWAGISVMCVWGRGSSQTDCQMPLVRVYQLSVCLPMG